MTKQPRCERCEYGLITVEDYYGRPEIFRCPDCGGSGVKEEEES